jgi:hypothetical protein
MSTTFLVFWLAICGFVVWLAIDAKRWRAGCDLSWWMAGQRAPDWYVKWTRPVFLCAFLFTGAQAIIIWSGG